MPDESKLLKSCLNPWLHGLDMYPAGATIQDVLAKSGLAADEIIQLNRNETTIGTSPKVIAAVEKAVSSANYYPEVNCQDLVDDLTDHYSGLGLDMNKLGIVIGNGMDSILDNIAHLFLSKDSSIIVSSPTFIYYELIANWSGAELIDVPRNIDKENNIYTTDPDAILAAVKDNTKVVFLCSPNNPTGELTDIETIEYLAKNLDCMLYVDHAYIQFCEDKQDARHLIEKYPNLIVGYTFSKAYAMAGYRVGYAIMHQEIKNRFLQVEAPFLLSRLSVIAAKVAIKDDEHLAEVIESNNEGREFYYEEIAKLGFEFFRSDANFVLMRHPKHKALDITEALLKQGIMVRPMKAVCPYSIRVTIGTAAQNERLIKALTDIVGA